MADKITENKETTTNWQDLPILNRNESGKHLLVPLSPNLINLGKRIGGDAIKTFNDLNETNRKRGFLKIENDEARSVNKLLGDAEKVVKRSFEGFLPTNENLKELASYLDWSYQQQVGVPASQSNQTEATQNGTGAKDVWSLFTSIKNKLDGDNQKENMDRRV